MNRFLAASPFIDFGHPAVAAKARELGDGASSQLDLIRRCFEFVRDGIRHSADFQVGPVTCKASEVLQHRTGFCYAKSHLLAALLRFHGVPTGLCYQRLVANDTGTAFCLHGLNAVQLPGGGWYRLDARGNKPGVSTEFCPPREALAYAARLPQERDLPEIWAEPLPVVVDALQASAGYDDVLRRLPDIELLA